MEGIAELTEEQKAQRGRRTKRYSDDWVKIKRKILLFWLGPHAIFHSRDEIFPKLTNSNCESIPSLGRFHPLRKTHAIVAFHFSILVSIYFLQSLTVVINRQQQLMNLDRLFIEFAIFRHEITANSQSIENCLFTVAYQILDLLMSSSQSE
jgi:hypothetical protein